MSKKPKKLKDNSKPTYEKCSRQVHAKRVKHLALCAQLKNLEKMTINFPTK